MVGMHERFHDTLNLAKRKPRRLAGTPAYKFNFWLALSSASILTYMVFIYKEFEFTRATRERWMMRMLPDEAMERKKLLFGDPYLRSALLNLEERQMNRADPLKPSDVSPAIY